MVVMKTLTLQRLYILIIGFTAMTVPQPLEPIFNDNGHWSGSNGPVNGKLDQRLRFHLPAHHAERRQVGVSVRAGSRVWRASHHIHDQTQKEHL